MSTPIRATEQQRHALAFITEAAAPVTRDELAAELVTAPEGAALTAASLVRRGLARRVTVRVDGRSRVAWTAAG